MELIDAADRLSRTLSRLRFAPPVAQVYNPLVYARDNYVAYLEAYGRGRKRVVYLGMNPGPWGMAQTGVPFGDTAMVRDWLGLDRPVRPPRKQHPKRPILGLDCGRSEVSGTRLWGAVREHYGTPRRFFEHCFVANYCPLCFMEPSGRNRTPDKLPASERKPLYAACDEHLRATVRALEPRWVVGVGAFAAKRAQAALEGMAPQVGQVLHPSPASPAANKDWAGKAAATLRELGLCDQC